MAELEVVAFPDFLQLTQNVNPFSDYKCAPEAPPSFSPSLVETMIYEQDYSSNRQELRTSGKGLAVLFGTLDRILGNLKAK